VCCTDNNQLKAAAEEMAAGVTAMAVATVQQNNSSNGNGNGDSDGGDVDGTDNNQL
jgi:hypothetical protein